MRVSPAEIVPQTPSRAAPRWRPLAPYLLAAVLAVIARLPTLTNTIIFIDEPIYLMQARRLSSWETFIYAFQYRAETKFQLGIVPYLAALAVNYPNAILIIHIFGLIAVIASVCLMVALSRRLFGNVIPGFIALALWLCFLMRGYFTAATLLEYFQTPVVLLAFWLLLDTLDGNTPRRAACLTGLCVAAAALIKPPAILLGPVMVAALLCLPRRPVRVRLVTILIYSASVALPIGAFVLPYVLRPAAMDDLIFNLFDITSRYASRYGSLTERVRDLLSIFYSVNVALIGGTLALFTGVAAVALWQKGWQRIHTDQLLLLATGGALFVGYAAATAKAYYMLPVLPFLFLCVGYRLWVLFGRLARWRVQWLMAAAVLAAVLYSERGSVVYYASLYRNTPAVYAAQMPAVDVQALVGYITGHSTADDRLWVYYNAPEVYWQANRYPATIELTGTWLVDYYDSFWFARMRDQLAQERPKLIVGIDKAPRFPRTQAGKLTDIPLIRDFLAQAYTCDTTAVANTTICTRKENP